MRLLIIKSKCILSQDYLLCGPEALGDLRGCALFWSFASAAFRARMLERRCFWKSRIVTMARLPELATRPCI
jgi:hypothetical protein